MKTIAATRYVTPLREAGSLPAIVEADDDGLYVLKFRGAGQGPRALIAELLSGEIARMLGLPVPEIVLMDLDRDLARTEPDAEVQSLIQASEGQNLALDYLPGSITFDPLICKPDEAQARSGGSATGSGFIGWSRHAARSSRPRPCTPDVVRIWTPPWSICWDTWCGGRIKGYNCQS